MSQFDKQVIDYIGSIRQGDIENLLSYAFDDGTNKPLQNMNTGIEIDADDDSYEVYHIKTDMFWPQISNLIYGTTSLYWLLQQLNTDIQTDMFGKITAPNHIKYLPNALEIINYNS